MKRMRMQTEQRGSAKGTFITLVLSVLLIALGGWLVLNQDVTDTLVSRDSEPSAAGPRPAAPEGEAPLPIEPVSGSPLLEAPGVYIPKDKVIEVDISEYAGYSGLIVANGGLAPNPDSFFARNYGFQVKLSMSEYENWSQLNNGRFAAAATTADVLAVLGRPFQVSVPALIGFSRGADMVVVDKGIVNVNELKGKVLAASQFNESEFFIRYLAKEAGLPVKVLRDLDGRPSDKEVGLVFYEDAFLACDAYAHELSRSRPRLNGCVGWTPRTDEVVEESAGHAKVLVSNRNLLIIADILTVNKQFSDANPEVVKGLVHGLLEGNRLLRDEPDAHVSVVAQAFGWTEEETRDELSYVHLANLPENIAFFEGTIDAAGSFGSIFQSSVLAYGNMIKNPTDAERFADMSHLQALSKQGLYANQKIAIAPIRSSMREPIEGQALLSKDIRFFFEPNSAVLDQKAKENLEYLGTIKQFLQVSPGSMVLLRGHVDDAKVPEFRREGGDKLVQTMALKAMELSKQRATSVRDALLAKFPKLDASRVETVGRGWEEPAGSDSDQNRRVEVQWFTLE